MESSLTKYKWWSREELLGESLEDLKAYLQDLQAEHERMFKAGEIFESQFIARTINCTVIPVIKTLEKGLK